MIEMTARRELVYAARTVRPGETFHAAPQHARVLRAVGKAELAPVKSMDTENSGAIAPPRVPPRRRYHSRHIAQAGMLDPVFAPPPASGDQG